MMLEKLKKTIEEVEESKEHKDEFLCSAFMMSVIKDIENEEWQIDYYKKGKDRISSYKKVNGKIEQINKEEEIFKEEEAEIKPLEIEKVRIDFEEARKKGEEELKNRNEEANKIIVILQQEDEPIWNITLLTTTFNMLNMKISAETGEVKEKKFVSLLNFK